MQVYHPDCQSQKWAVIFDIWECSHESFLLAGYELRTSDWLNQILIESTEELADLGKENLLADAHSELVWPVLV